MRNVSLTVLIMACSVLVFVVSPEKCAPWDAGRASPSIYSSLMATSTSMNCTVCQFLRTHTEINDNTSLKGLSSLWFVKCVKLSSQKSKENSVPGCCAGLCLTAWWHWRPCAQLPVEAQERLEPVGQATSLTVSCIRQTWPHPHPEGNKQTVF